MLIAVSRMHDEQLEVLLLLTIEDATATVQRLQAVTAAAMRSPATAFLLQITNGGSAAGAASHSRISFTRSTVRLCPSSEQQLALCCSSPLLAQSSSLLRARGLRLEDMSLVTTAPLTGGTSEGCLLKGLNTIARWLSYVSGSSSPRSVTDACLCMSARKLVRSAKAKRDNV